MLDQVDDALVWLDHEGEGLDEKSRECIIHLDPMLLP